MALIDTLHNHFFWKYGCKDNGLFAQSDQLVYKRIQAIMKWGYLFFLFYTYAWILGSDYLYEAQLANPLWPIKLLDFLPLKVLVYVIEYGLLLVFLVLSYNNRNWSLRVLSFILFFFYAALTNSFGKINHSLHLPLMILFCFALMPNKKISDYRHKTILMFASAQFFLLLAYSLTGFWKLFWGVIQAINGQVSIFSSLSFRNILIEQFQVFNAPTLGAFFMEHYIFGWICYWLVILVELLSLSIFFKPRFHKLWGVFLILLHVSTALVLGVGMYGSIMAIGILLIMSPFYKLDKNFQDSKSV